MAADKPVSREDIERWVRQYIERNPPRPPAVVTTTVSAKKVIVADEIVLNGRTIRVDADGNVVVT